MTNSPINVILNYQQENGFLFNNQAQSRFKELNRSFADNRNALFLLEGIMVKGINKGSKNGMWKGGRKKHVEGYIFILSPNHPFAPKSGYILEHRLVMEKYLGRYLKPYEYEKIHHKGIRYPLGSIENKQDNKIDNLELIVSGQNWHDKNCPKCGFKFVVN